MEACAPGIHQGRDAHVTTIAPPPSASPAPSAGPGAAPVPPKPAPRPTPAPPPIPAGVTLRPLQLMTERELRRGLHVIVHDDAQPPPKQGGSQPAGGTKPRDGFDWGGLAVARVVQDAAQFMSQTAGVKPSLKEVTINDRRANDMAAAGYALFRGPNHGAFHLSPMTTRDIVAGLKHLRTEPMSKWSLSDASAFVSANEVILHEADHITLPSYDQGTIDDFYRDPRRRGLEEAFTEIASSGRLTEWFRARYGQDVPADAVRVGSQTGVYTRYVERTRNLLSMAGITDEHQIVDAAQRLGDAVTPSRRFRDLAEQVAKHAGGDKAPIELVDRLERSLPRFIDERPATGIRTVLGALGDLRDGRVVDMPALRARLEEIDEIGRKADRRDGWPGRR